MGPRCETCTHFRQHYVKQGRRYVKASGGHCVHPRVKLRFGRTPACAHYEERLEKNKEVELSFLHYF